MLSEIVPQCIDEAYKNLKPAIQEKVERMTPLEGSFPERQEAFKILIAGFDTRDQKKVDSADYMGRPFWMSFEQLAILDKLCGRDVMLEAVIDNKVSFGVA